MSEPSSFRRLFAVAALASLAGCSRAVLDPAGAVALQQRNIIFISTGLMLLIIVPVMILTVIFAWHYRKGNRAATYDPHFDHSTALELVIWSAPLLIIICLGALTWSSTHLLDPFRPLDRSSAGHLVDPEARPMRVQVVSLDWKWLFIYPELGVASVNELALPIDRQVRFEMTSTNMMNTFYAPSMAGMIYTMPGMRSTLHAVLNRAGESEGMSANYSGAGFSDMRFRLKGMDQAGFDRWVAETKASRLSLTTANFLRLEKPSEKVPPIRFAAVDAGLFDRVVERCVRPGTPCMSEVMRRDRQGGADMPGRHGAAPPGGPKLEGALFKDTEQMRPAPNVTKPRAPADGKSGPPGSTEPASPRNRDMS